MWRRRREVGRRSRGWASRERSTSVDANEVVALLRTSLVTPETARIKPKGGGIPNEPGLYAWFCDADVLPGVPLDPSDEAGHRVIYVGIAPSRPGSRQTLRGRICGNHL